MGIKEEFKNCMVTEEELQAIRQKIFANREKRLLNLEDAIRNHEPIQRGFMLGELGMGHAIRVFRTAKECCLPEMIPAPTVEVLKAHIEEYGIKGFDFRKISILKDGIAESVCIHTDGTVISASGISYQKGTEEE